MLYVELEPGPSSTTKGPFEFLILAGAKLALPDGSSLADLTGGLWQTEGAGYGQLAIGQLVEVQFEDGQRRSVGHGPFERLVIDGMHLLASGRSTPLARLDDGALIDELGQKWSAAMITPSVSAHG